jgi:hypothetical protein
MMQTDVTRQESGLAKRGLLLLGLMLAIAAVVGFVLFRPTSTPVPEDDLHPELIAAAVPGMGASSLYEVNWGALASLSQLLPSSPGWQVRYNTTLTYARRGSPNLPLAVLSEMLDEDRQMRNFRARLADGKDVPDEYAARQTVYNALHYFGEWQQHKDAVASAQANPELQRVYAAVDKLTHSKNDVLRKEAERVKSNSHR